VISHPYIYFFQIVVQERELRVPVKVIVSVALLISPILVVSQTTPDLVELEVYEDGWVNVSYEVSFSESELVVYLPLYGSDPSFLLVLDEEGLPLNASVIEGFIEVQSLGANRISVSYFTQEIVWKKGGVWTINLSGIPTRVLITLPSGARIVGLSDVPETIITEEGERIRLLMPPEAKWVSYALTFPSALEEGKGGLPKFPLFLALGIGALAVAMLLKIRVKGRRELDSVDRRILRELASGGMYLKELAGRIEKSKTTAWRRCRSLEESGLLKVIRRADGNFIELTSSGRALVRELEREPG